MGLGHSRPSSTCPPRLPANRDVFTWFHAFLTLYLLPPLLPCLLLELCPWKHWLSHSDSVFQGHVLLSSGSPSTCPFTPDLQEPPSHISWMMPGNCQTGELSDSNRPHIQGNWINPDAATPGSEVWTPSRLWGKSKGWPQGQAAHLQG